MTILSNSLQVNKDILQSKESYGAPLANFTRNQGGYVNIQIFFRRAGRREVAVSPILVKTKDF